MHLTVLSGSGLPARFTRPLNKPRPPRGLPPYGLGLTFDLRNGAGQCFRARLSGRLACLEPTRPRRPDSLVIVTTETAAVTAGIINRIAAELAVRDHQVAAAVDLLDGGATVPFIARYRKEATGTLDDAKLRTLEERLRYLRELEERRAAILASVGEQGKLTDELASSINAADTKARLEDLYLPYKPKRRTKAQIARENGLEPLADLLLGDPATDPREAAGGYRCENVADAA